AGQAHHRSSATGRVRRRHGQLADVLNALSQSAHPAGRGGRGVAARRTGVAEGAGLGLVRLLPGGGPICLRTALAHDLVVNAQTARRLGINILSEMIAKADWVVE